MMVIRRFINISKGQLHYHQFLACGFQLGGNIVPGNLRNTSIVYGRKNNNYIVKISSTSLQFKKSLKCLWLKISIKMIQNQHKPSVKLIQKFSVK